MALIAGPTASGKSDLAVELALALEKAGRQAVVINADSAQVYADLRVLSARPSEEDMRGVDHRLFGAWDGAQACSAADWAAAAKEQIAKAHAGGKVPILVGGTGLYIKVLLEGIAHIPAIDPAVREKVRALPTQEAWDALLVEDPERAAALAPADSQRIARALEVIRSTGHGMDYWHRSQQGGIGNEISLHPLVLLPDRETVYEKCDKRFEWMMDHGAVEEVSALNSRDLHPDLPVMRAIGVPEITALLKGDVSREEAIAGGQQSTRNYAKRQFTWLRNQLPEDWKRAAPDSVDIPDNFESLFHI